jgi:integrase
MQNLTLLQTRASLADVAAAVSRAPDVPRPDDVAADIARICALLERDPADVPADLHWLQVRLSELEPGHHGIGHKRLSNMRSSLKAALRCSGIVRPCTKPIEQLSPAWADLWAKVKAHDQSGSWLRPALSPFFRYADAHGIKPEHVDGVVFDEYCEHRRKTGLGKNPEKAVQKTRRAWNKAQQEVPGWPAFVLPSPGDEDYLFKLTDFLKSFQADIDAYKAAALRAPAASASDGQQERRRYRLRDRSAQPKHDPLAPTTLAGQVETIRLAASTLVREGERRIEDIRAIRDVISVDTLGLVCDCIVDRTGAPTGYGLTQGKRFRSIAVRWLQPSEEELEEYNKLIGELREDGVTDGMTPKNRERLRPFDDPALFARLLSLPERVMEELEVERKRTGVVTSAMALQAEASMGILILITLPVRRGALMRTHRDENFRWPVTRNGEGTLCYGPREDTKTGQVLTAVLKSWKVKLFRIYCSHYQSVLAPNRQNRYLFPGHTALGHRTPGSLSATIVGLIWERLGIRINLHLFRHLMATKLLEASEGNIALVSQLLGHSDNSKVTEVYAELKAKIAARHLETVIERQKQAAPRRARRPRAGG